MPVADDALAAAQLERTVLSPFSTHWMSFIDPSRARDELGFHHLPLDAYLGRIAASFLAHPPPAPPPGYQHRAREIALALAIQG